MSHFLFLFSFLFILSCTPPADLDNGVTQLNINNTFNNEETINDEDEDRQSFSRCGENYRDGELSIEEFDYIDSQNITNYEISGDCDKKGERIDIKVNGHELKQSPYCSGRKWEVTINLNPAIAESDEHVSFEISNGYEDVCANVRLTFSNPKNYIAIPGLEGYYKNTFFVMKYEAKYSSDKKKAVSTPNDRPIVNVGHAEAVKLCRSNGSRYRLMSNEQWQNIARDIASIDENWKEGTISAIDGNEINCGVRSASGYREASSSDSDDCASSSCGNDWHRDRRTHFLSTGQVIWDICGNAGEIVRDKYTGLADLSFDGLIYKITGKLKELFGPKKGYSNGDRHNNYLGFGEATIKKSKTLIIRGGGRYPGIFSVQVEGDIEDTRTRNNVGFRCVYIP